MAERMLAAVHNVQPVSLWTVVNRSEQALAA